MRLIGSGELRPGDLLPPEATVCEMYSVGRSVVREAFQALDAKGFVLVRQGATTSVAPKRNWHVLDPDFLEVNTGAEFFELLQETRDHIEPQIAALAAARATKEQIVAMEAILERQSATSSPKEHAELDIAFHEAIARATDNSVLASMHDLITGLGHRARVASTEVDGAMERAEDWHRIVLEAIKKGDSEGASAAMFLHLRQVRSELAKVNLANMP
nr:FCD domain-containing protein [Microbacterium immunditiarum]